MTKTIRSFTRKWSQLASIKTYLTTKQIWLRIRSSKLKAVIPLSMLGLTVRSTSEGSPRENVFVRTPTSWGTARRSWWRENSSAPSASACLSSRWHWYADTLFASTALWTIFWRISLLVVFVVPRRYSSIPLTWKLMWHLILWAGSSTQDSTWGLWNIRMRISENLTCIRSSAKSTLTTKALFRNSYFMCSTEISRSVSETCRELSWFTGESWVWSTSWGLTSGSWGFL